MPAAKYNFKDIEVMRKLYYKDKLTIREIHLQYPLASRATIANYIAGYASSTGANICPVHRDEAKTDSCADRAKKLQQISMKIFKEIKPKQKVKLVHNRNPGEVKHFWQPLLVKEGIVIQKTKGMIVVQDKDKPFIKANITLNDLISQTGGIRIQLVG